MQFLQIIISGIAQGCIYGLIALGFVLIYKATETVSFAQGDLMMLGAFLGLALMTALSFPFWLAVVASIAARFVVLATEEKCVPKLGTRCPIPIEVVPFATSTVARRLEALGARPVLRVGPAALAGRDDRVCSAGADRSLARGAGRDAENGRHGADVWR